MSGLAPKYGAAIHVVNIVADPMTVTKAIDRLAASREDVVIDDDIAAGHYLIIVRIKCLDGGGIRVAVNA